MLIFPAIDIYGGKAVRLYKGSYEEMTVYSERPEEVARAFTEEGAECLHLVDLEGARDGGAPNMDTIRRILSAANMFTEVGGGIRSMEAVERYLDTGVDRVILGTAAATDPEFLERALAKYPGHIAVGVDIRDGYVAIKGWRESSGLEAMAFCRRLDGLGVSAVICTDISRDGAMAGANHGLYQDMAKELKLSIIASGGVSSMEDVRRLRAMDIHGAIIGKAYYTGAISLREAIEAAR